MVTCFFRHSSSLTIFTVVQIIFLLETCGNTTEGADGRLPGQNEVGDHGAGESGQGDEGGQQLVDGGQPGQADVQVEEVGAEDDQV